jgi:membrane-associated phospholipid phosphatase
MSMRAFNMGSPWTWGPPLAALLLGGAVYLSGTNQAVFLLINGLGAATGDSVWAIITIFGDALMVSALLLPLVDRRPDVILAMLLASVPATLWVHGLKPWLALPRPPAVLPAQALHIIGPMLTADSFPSGHATTIFTFAGVMVLGASSRLARWSVLLLAAAVGLSRSAVGAHWPLDVLGGLLGGWLAAVAGWWAALRLPAGLQPAVQRLLAAWLVTAAVILLLFRDGDYPQAMLMQRMVAALCLLAGIPGLLHLFSGERENMAAS